MARHRIIVYRHARWTKEGVMMHLPSPAKVYRKFVPLQRIYIFRAPQACLTVVVAPPFHPRTFKVSMKPEKSWPASGVSLKAHFFSSAATYIKTRANTFIHLPLQLCSQFRYSRAPRARPVSITAIRQCCRLAAYPASLSRGTYPLLIKSIRSWGSALIKIASRKF